MQKIRRDVSWGRCLNSDSKLHPRFDTAAEPTPEDLPQTWCGVFLTLATAGFVMSMAAAKIVDLSSNETSLLAQRDVQINADYVGGS